MSRRAFFAWDRGLRSPVPVVFYDAVPTIGGKPQPLLAVHEIPGGTDNPEFFRTEAESPSFAALAQWRPAPAQEIVP